MPANSNSPLILVTNDDGYYAPGIKALIDAAQTLGQVVVVAPDKAQSGMGHAITINSTLRLERLNNEPFEAHLCTGTPVDCVKIALDVLLTRKPDLILSGINHGSNASINVIYSGTMSAALEGYIEGVPSIGFSLTDHRIDADFTAAANFAKHIAAAALKNRDRLFCLNVNIPNLESEFIKGIKICRQAHAKWQEEFDKRKDPNGRDYYWLTGHFVELEKHDEDTDLWALANGYVSVVPVGFDLTKFDFIDQLKQWKL